MSAFADSILSAANKAYLASLQSSTINFVTDCGADPTGVADCTPALNTAGVLLTSLASDPKLPKQACKLFIPRGRYKVTGSPNAWDMSGASPQCIEVMGVQDASIFECNQQVSGGGIFKTVNGLEVRYDGLTFVGTEQSPDTAYCIFSNSTLRTSVERCRFQSIFSSGPIVYAIGQLRMDTCEFINLACLDATKAAVMVDSQNGVQISRVNFLDGGSPVNGYVFGIVKSGGTCWLRINGLSSLAGSSRLVRLEGVMFDEGCIQALTIVGPVGKIPLVELIGIECNPCIVGSPTATFHVENVERLIVDGVTNTGLNTGKDEAVLELVNVGHAIVAAFDVNAAALARYVTADAACGAVEIDDGSIADVDVRSSATRTAIKANGVTYDLVAANGTIVANQLCKLGASGAVALATTDGSAVMAGAARQAAAPAGRVAFSRVGQIVPLLNDNNAAIAAGDQVIVSASVAGRIRTGTTAGKGVGIAVVGSAQAPDAITYVRIQPF